MFDNCAMLATAWKGQSFSYTNRIRYGPRVGCQNRDKYFQQWPSVSIDFYGRTVEVPLLPGFWKRCPELRHEQFGEWFKELELLPW